jgi:membrane-associated phospholipid phosphatase
MVLLGVGVARVAVGDHWPSDVLGGYILAGTWVTVVLIGVRSNVSRSSSDRP